MAKMRGSSQILDNSIDRGRLELDFLDGSNLNLTNGNNDATITGLIAGTAANDAVNYQQLTDLIDGIKKRFVATVKAQGNISNLSGFGPIDGVTLVDGDTVLLSEQTTTTQDGLWIARTGAWERALFWEVGDDVGAYFLFVKEGTDDNRGFVCTNNTGSDIVGTDDLVFQQVSGAGTLNAGAGMVQNGADFDVVATDLSLMVNVDDMRVNIGNTNGNSLEVSANGLELMTNITGPRNFAVMNSALDINTNNITFTDREITNATISTAIPMTIQTTVDHGSGTATGDVIDDFRAAFTDEAIINAIMELHTALDSQINIYAADGSLLSDRILTADDYDLTFTGDSTGGEIFRFEREDSTINRDGSIEIDASNISLILNDSTATGYQSSIGLDSSQVLIGYADTTTSESSELELTGDHGELHFYNATIGDNLAITVDDSNVLFLDSEVLGATISTAIPHAITPTVNYGNGNGTSAGDSINQFRSEFTDGAIINAILEIKALIDNPDQIVEENLTVANNASVTLTGGDTASTVKEVYLNGNRIILTTEYTVGDNGTNIVVTSNATNQEFTNGDVVTVLYIA